METLHIRYGIEDLTSRVPGLFPYIEFMENGTSAVRSAKDSMTGSYGQIACGIKLPDDVELVVDGVVYLPSGSSCSYRTLMNLYYEYKGILPANHPFIMFMDRCIGLFRITAPIDRSECDLVPEYMYYAECARLYSEYANMGRMCELYQQMKSLTGEVNCELECLVTKYARLGGDVMRDYYGEMAVVAVDEADWILDNCADISAATVGIGLNMVRSEDDLGVLSTYLNPWEPNVRYVGGDIVTYNGRTYVCTCQEGEYTEGIWDPTTETMAFDTQHFSLLAEDYYAYGLGPTCNINGTVESSLGEFKENICYTDEGGSQVYPTNGEDWLWFYKIGKVGQYDTLTDELGNIMIINGHSRQTVINEYETHLMAYGDVLTNITCDEDNMTVTFTYVIGCNLKARLTDIQVDPNGDTKYYYGSYEFNENDGSGVVHTETYRFSGDLTDINEIISNGDFNTYVTQQPLAYRYHRCPFNTQDNTVPVEFMSNGYPATANYIMSDFLATVYNERDSFVSPTFKTDYLVGVTFNPSIDANVFINRGNSAAWERHVKLGEIKSFEDLTNYANGGFFNMM